VRDVPCMIEAQSEDAMRLHANAIAAAIRAEFVVN
jgi:hypothetical protein